MVMHTITIIFIWIQSLNSKTLNINSLNRKKSKIKRCITNVYIINHKITHTHII